MASSQATSAIPKAAASASRTVSDNVRAASPGGAAGQGKAWIFESDLVLFGDSLFDNGNWIRLALPGDPVLSEGISLELGLEPASIVSAFSLGDLNPLETDITLDDVSRLSPKSFRFSLNYAVAGATSASFGSTAVQQGQLGDDEIGLQSQVDKYLSEVSPAALKNPRFAQDYGLISAGSNDVFEFLANLPSTNPTELLQAATVKIDQITGNIIGAINKIDPYLNSIVVLGLTPLSRTPLLQENPLAGQLADFITSTVNLNLRQQFDNPLDNREDVFVVEGFEVFNEAQRQYAEATGDFEFSGFWLDAVHPSKEAISYLSPLIANQILTAFPDFTFG